MELAICPTCKQSVLDDDAVECPFCGSPMKAGAAPARPKPSAAGQPATSGAGKGAKGPAAPAKPAEDDPFGVDPAATAKAVALSPKPAPGKSFEVRCPMCETVGYASTKVQGHSVRCCNPKCMVPVFTVKAPKREEPPPPPPVQPKSPLPMYVVGGLALAGLAGGLLYYLNSIKAPEQMSALPPVARQEGRIPEPTEDQSPEIAGQPTVEAKAADPASVRAADLKESLNRAIEASLKAPAAKKSFARRLAALAMVHAGDRGAAEDQLTQLRRVSGQSPYEVIPPLALASWRFHPEGSPERAAALEELKRHAPQLPKRGRFAIESGLATATLQASAGDLAGARDTLAAHRAAPRVEQLAALMQLVNLDGSFDLDAPQPGRLAGDWQTPLETGLTLQLCQQSRWEAAETWARQLTDPLARDESLLAFAELSARRQLSQQPPGDLSAIQALAESLSPVGKLRLATRLAAVHSSLGQAEGARQQVAAATTQLGGVAVSTPPRLPTLKSVFDSKTPDPIQPQQLGRACQELAQVQLGLKQPEEAWKTLKVGLAHLRGAGPGLLAIRKLRARGEGTEVEGLRRELKRSLALANDDQVQRELTRFRQRTADLERAAQVRFRGQIDLLAAGLEMGLAESTWKEALAIDGQDGDDDRDPVLSSALPPLAALAFERSGKQEQAQKIRSEFANRAAEAEPQEATRIIPYLLAQACEAGEVPRGLELLKTYLTESGDLQAETLRLMCQLINRGKLETAYQLANGVPLESLRDDALFLMAARTARLDRGGPLKKVLPKVPSVNDAASLYSGMASGWGELSRSTASGAP
jgi:hypothetical protein